MTNDGLNQLCLNLNNKKYFKGVFMTNGSLKINAPNNDQSRFNIIINVIVDGNIGHFVNLFVYPSKIIYFDPIGIPPIHHEICSYIYSLKRNTTIWNKTQIQDISSPACSLYSLLYTLLFNQYNINIKNVKKCKFYKNKRYLHCNDQLCLKYIMEML